MLYIGFICNVVAFSFGVLLLVGYIVLFLLKKNAILERFSLQVFLAFLVILMTLSWSLILMNEGYNVNLYLSIDYSYVLLIAVPLVIAYEIFDTIQRSIIKKSDKWYINVVRYLLPVLTGILFFVCTLIFYFNCHYFVYLRM